MTDPAMVTVYHRVQRGESWEEAMRPGWQPLWMWRIEQEEGRPMKELLVEGAESAARTGYSLRDLCAEWGVPYSRVKHWTSKWDIHFPNHVSARHVEAATRNLQSANLAPRKKRSSVSYDDFARLLEACGGSQHQVGRLLGVTAQQVSGWKHRHRPIPGKYAEDIERLLAQPKGSMIHKRKAHKISADHPWR